MNKLVKSVLLSASLVGIAHADVNTGTIIKYHLNSDNGYVNREVGYGDRAVCIQMKPAIATGGWACLFTGNRLYKEIDTLLREGYMSKKKCAIAGNFTDSDGYLMIEVAECL